MRVIQRSGGHRSRRYLLRDPSPLSTVDALLTGSGWSRIAVRQADHGQGLPLLAMWELFPGLRVRYSEDELPETCYAMITSTLGARSVVSASAVFEVHPAVVGFATLLSELDDASDGYDLGVAIARAGLGAPLEEDARLTGAVLRCVASENSQVREGALWAISYAEWPCFRRTLAQVSAGDSEPFLRDLAAGTLRSFDQVGIGSPGPVPDRLGDVVGDDAGQHEPPE
jgi:hypothetical protein